jgi:hypothetical protein
MTAPPEPPEEPRSLSWTDEDEWGGAEGSDMDDDLPELTVPIDDDSLGDALPVDGGLTARLGEPGGEVGIGSPPADEAAIPMLTEVLLAPPPAPATRVAPPPPAPAGDDVPDLDRLALQVEASVLENLQLRTDAQIEGPLHERLQAVIEITTERLVDEIRETVRQAIREAVGRAISEELARVHRQIDEHDDHPPAA